MYNIKLSCAGILQHFHELWPLVYAATADPAICVYVYQLVVGITVELPTPVLLLKLIAVNLCLAGR